MFLALQGGKAVVWDTWNCCMVGRWSSPKFAFPYNIESQFLTEQKHQKKIWCSVDALDLYFLFLPPTLLPFFKGKAWNASSIISGTSSQKAWRLKGTCLSVSDSISWHVYLPAAPCPRPGLRLTAVEIGGSAAPPPAPLGVEPPCSLLGSANNPVLKEGKESQMCEKWRLSGEKAFKREGSNRIHEEGIRETPPVRATRLQTSCLFLENPVRGEMKCLNVWQVLWV